MISIGLLLLTSVVRGDISEKLKQGQGLEGRPTNVRGLQPPLFDGSFKETVQKASGATNSANIAIPRHSYDENNLDRLCNDPFHSFLCMPVGPRKHRLDGRLRPGAVLPSGMFFGSSSDFKESKEPLTMGGALLSSEIDGNESPKPSNNVPSISKTPGYSYPKPSEPFVPHVSKNMQDGYVYPKPLNPLPFPSQQVTTRTPPPGPLYQYLPALASQTPKTDETVSNQFIREPTFQSKTATATNNFLEEVPFRSPVAFLASPYTTTRGLTSRPNVFPTTERSTSRPSVFPTTQRTTYRPSLVPTSQRTTSRPRLAPTTQRTTSRPSLTPTTQRTTSHPSLALTTERTTSRPNLFSTSQRTNQPPKIVNTFLQAKSSQTFTTHSPVNTLPKYMNKQSNLNAQEATNGVKNTVLPPSNQYLPYSNQEPKPTNQFPISAAPKPSHEYLPAEDVQSTNIQPNVEGGALLANEIAPNSGLLRKHERNHTLEELCNDAFHSFLCKPITKPRKRIDGKIRPGAKIPPHVLQGAGSADDNLRRIPPNQEGQAILSSEIENHGVHRGYQYQVPQISFASTNFRNEFLYPRQFGNPFMLEAASDSLSLAKQFTGRNNLPTQTFAPVDTSVRKQLGPSVTANYNQIANRKYYYTKPLTTEKPKSGISIGFIPTTNQLNENRYKEASRNTDRTSLMATAATQTGYYYPKPTKRPFLPAGPSQIENKGYQYPKPSAPFDSTGSSQNNGYFYPKPTTVKPNSLVPAGSHLFNSEYPTIKTTTTTTVRPEPVPAATNQGGTNQGYQYPKPSINFPLPTTKPHGYVYTKPPKGREFTLPSSVPFGVRLSKTVKQYNGQQATRFLKQENDDLPPASQFEILKP